MLLIKVIILLLIGFFAILVGSTALIKNPRKSNNIAFWGLSSSLAAWTIGVAGFLYSNDYNLALLWAKVLYFFPLLIAFLLYIFVQLFQIEKFLNFY